MKKLLSMLMLLTLVSCRKTSTCTCKTRDGFGSVNTITSNRREVETFENECRQTKVLERDGTTSPCTVD